MSMSTRWLRLWHVGWHCREWATALSHTQAWTIVSARKMGSLPFSLQGHIKDFGFKRWMVSHAKDAEGKEPVPKCSLMKEEGSEKVFLSKWALS